VNRCDESALAKDLKPCVVPLKFRELSLMKM
jgi:hypothetical protein